MWESQDMSQDVMEELCMVEINPLRNFGIAIFQVEDEGFWLDDLDEVEVGGGDKGLPLFHLGFVFIPSHRSSYMDSVI